MAGVENKFALIVMPLVLAWIAAQPAIAGEWSQGPGYRALAVEPGPSGKAGFTLMPASQTGVTFSNTVPLERHLTNQIFLNGSGLACGDVDGDGQCDLLFCGVNGTLVLYKNLGQWRFEDITAQAGLNGRGLPYTGVLLVDIDGDGDLDVVISTLNFGLHLFFNDGHGRFQPSSQSGILNAKRGGLSMVMGDVDGDGDLDLYVANYRSVTIRDEPNTPLTIGFVNGQPVVQKVGGRPLTHPDLTNRFSFNVKMADGRGSVQIEEHGEPDALFINNGNGQFSEVSWTGGAFLDESGNPLREPLYEWGQSVVMRDINQDGFPDIYVCNDFISPDRLWLGDGRGHFRLQPTLAIRHQTLASMGADFADINRDGWDDFLVLDMLSRDHRMRFAQRPLTDAGQPPLGAYKNRPQYPRNMLYLNQGDGTWAEIADFAILDAADWAWTPIFLDVDLDGYEDLLVANGFERDNMHVDTLQELDRTKKTSQLSSIEQLRLRQRFPRLDTPNCAFRNLGNLRFADVSSEWGFDTRAVSQGMALADLDNDGDLDVVINNFNGQAGLYRNNSSAPRVGVRLKGRPPNTRGIGARIKVLGGAVPLQSQEIQCGGRYLSTDDAMRVFAAGRSERMTIEVTWRSGRQSVITNALPNHIYEIDEASAVERAAPAPNTTPTPMFQDVSALLAHVHYEETFDDLTVQPLLPHRLTRLGPGVAWFDFNGDGRDDLAIGGGRGGFLAVYMNNGKGGFKKHEPAILREINGQSQTGIVALQRPNGQRVLVTGASNYEDGNTNAPSARVFNFMSDTIEAELPGCNSATGPLAAADYDGDGFVDLFVGGRVVSGRYPEPASSRLYRGRAAAFQLDRENSARLSQIGLVSGSVFTDLDGDGKSELVAACEWGPVRVFKYQPAGFVEVTTNLGLHKFPGAWNGVAAGDFDGDGKMDIVASNWGRNTRYERFSGQPIHLFAADFDNNGVLDIIEGWVDRHSGQLVPSQPFTTLVPALPMVREKMGSCSVYARATLQEIYGDALSQALHLQINWLDSTVFLNRGDHFEPRALPLEAQLAPAFAICVADFNNDGREDVLLSQNYFALPADIARMDAGRGLVLLGNGDGTFNSMPAALSGLQIYGEQRGAAVCDYDGDGRVDVVVTQNGAETKLYRNATASPGLRVRLAGPPGNPNAIGAAMRVIKNGKPLPMREIHAGSGYFSQDSFVQVFPFPASELWVRWPGGKITLTQIPEGIREMVVDASGQIVEKR